MAATTSLSSIIKMYTEKQKSPFIDFREFTTFIKKYAEHYIEEQPDLVRYLADTASTLTAELTGLSEKHLVGIIDANNKRTIVSTTYLSVKYATQYKEILKNESVPYPNTTDLPKQIPLSLFEKKSADVYLPELIEKENTNSPVLYLVDMGKDLGSILLPACVPIKVLIETAQIKLRKILRKEEYHDYFLKKLRSTNPTKSISIQHYYQNFIDVKNSSYIDFSQGDDYYLWNQTLYYIRQDFEKIQDKTIEDLNVLQAVKISEIHCTYLKGKFQESKKREEALRELENCLSSPPYFFTMAQVLKFEDKSGRTLYGRLSDEDFREFFQKMTTDGANNELPPLLVFKVASGSRYFIYKKNVITVVIRLCNEAHESITKILEENWLNSLLDFETLPEMTDSAAFEATLENLVEKNSPMLYAILNSAFMNILAIEASHEDSMQYIQLFQGGQLLPYSKILMISHKNIYSSVRARLPLHYTIPIISWILALIHKSKKKDNANKAKIHNSYAKEEKAEDYELPKKTKPVSKKEQFSSKAKEIASELVPEGSTVDRELDYLNKQWNRMITKEAYANLTEDVNTLIRDYTRKVVRTLTATTFTKDRIENLATTLVRTPNLQKIKDQEALTEYVTLYMLRLLSNS
ncbi:MAG: hypothetical protein SOT46_08780 [Treponema sp.]|nr:hypothetical protein [Spirochaetia bacterium]MDY2840445.1 hypothetical protein [Treponema sp.]MDY5124376.1 hypothetical protein [Treponema sp.]